MSEGAFARCSPKMRLRLDFGLEKKNFRVMTEEHLSALLSAAEAKKDDKGWVGAADGRLFTLYVAYGGAGLTVGRVESMRIEGKLVHARTNRG